MKKILLFATLIFFNIKFISAQSGCNPTLDPNTHVISSDTTITQAGPKESYLICSGVTMIYQKTSLTDTASYFLEEDATLKIRSVHNVKSIHMKKGSELDAGFSLLGANLPIIYDTWFEHGVIFTDTVNAGGAGGFIGAPDSCNSITYDKSQMPAGSDCAIIDTSTTDTSTVDSTNITSGLRDHERTPVNVIYPNPTVNSTVSVKVSAHTEKLVVYNILGKEVIVMTDLHSERKYNIDLSETGQGIYFFEFTTGQYKEIKKVIYNQ